MTVQPNWYRKLCVCNPNKAWLILRRKWLEWFAASRTTARRPAARVLPLRWPCCIDSRRQTLHQLREPLPHSFTILLRVARQKLFFAYVIQANQIFVFREGCADVL